VRGKVCQDRGQDRVQGRAVVPASALDGRHCPLRR
jgi:hypothetical protein